MDVQVVAAGDASAQPAAAPQSAQPVPVQPEASAPAQTQHAENSGALSSAIAKLFGSESLPQPLTLNVSYRVERPDIIVTVFSDPNTGKEVAQVPAEVMVQIAQFFDQHSGVTLDRSA